MSAPDVRGVAGRIPLGKLLGKGAEGAVYEVSGRTDAAAKIYVKPASAERSAKLMVMQSLLTPALAQLTAWPLEVLRDPRGNVCGFLMANLRDSKDVHRLYSPKSRLSEFPDADWRMLVRAALNTAKAFAVLHENGFLVGDVNHGGVRVAANATVKLIDCDSFQISSQGRTYLCEVGVQDFTPPELQGHVFRQTVRIANHDNFGLAVLIFQLLLNGRHPFAGRYRGPQEMPIEKAISQFRYAYGSNPASTGMQPPPHSASAIAASPQVAALWERAFGSAGVAPSGRPSAQEWVRVLSELEKDFTRCRVRASHYYFGGHGSCPWCPIEMAGVALFGIPMGRVATPTGGAFNMDTIWRDILAMAVPALPPIPALPHLAPSATAQAIGKRRGVWRGMGFAMATLIFVLGLAFDSSSFLLWLIVACVIGLWVNSRGGVDRSPLLAAQRQAKARYDDLSGRWKREEGTPSFSAKYSELKALRDEWTGLPAQRKQRFEQLVANRQKHALQAFLDQYEIERAKIPGIGAGKKAMLESFNIETAADITQHAVMQVPGFGPALTEKLMRWRRGIERNFRFDPQSAIDPRQIADLDRTIALRKADIENALQAGRAGLIQLRSAILARRQAIEGPLQQSTIDYAQATADLNAAR
jgi:DNA-binding helix-hairpin-helix protein with protein kinase domain